VTKTLAGRPAGRPTCRPWPGSRCPGRERQTTRVGGVGAILAVVFSGFLIGGAARWVVPGPDPMPFWLTVLIGLIGSVGGGAIAAAIFGAGRVVSTSSHAFVSVLLEIAVAASLVVLYRRVVQRRPLTGPDAYRFPSRGVGIARMRARLRQLGVDPDKLTGAAGAQEARGEQAAEELARLRDLHEKGVLNDEEYENARERLRRY